MKNAYFYQRNNINSNMENLKMPQMGNAFKRELRLQKIASILFILQTIAIVGGALIMLGGALSKHFVDFSFIVYVILGAIVAEGLAYAIYLLFYIVADISIAQKETIKYYNPVSIY